MKIFNSVNFTRLTVRLKALKARTAYYNQPYEVNREFANQFQAVWFNALRFDPAWVKLSSAEAKSLENYLYANELLVPCKEATVRVSPRTWAGIEARMLTVQEAEQIS